MVLAHVMSSGTRLDGTAVTDASLLPGKIVERFSQMLQADTGWLLLREETSKAFLLAAQRNLPPSMPVQLDQPWDDGISPLVAVSGEMLAIHGERLKRYKVATLGQAALTLAAGKLNYDPLQAVALGMMCNALVCLAVWLTGCATQRVDWPARIGQYTYDQAVAEMGPPEKQAQLDDGRRVAEWLLNRGSTYVQATPHLYGPYYGGFTPVHTAPSRLTRLTFETAARPADTNKDSREGHKSASIPALWAVQRQYGWCTPDGIRQAAAVMKVTPAYLESVASFYDLLRLEPSGTSQVLVCTNICLLYTSPRPRDP